MDTEHVNFSIDQAGDWLIGARRCLSPNWDARPSDMPISLLVVHAISLPPGEFGGAFVQDLFCNTLDYSHHPYFSTLIELRVSAHLYIERDGSLTQFVPFSGRAWHAGRSQFRGRNQCNDFSIGIELEGGDDTQFAPEQYRTLIAAARVILRRYPAITAESIVGHSDIAPGRKTDPGPFFDWTVLRAGIAKPS